MSWEIIDSQKKAIDTLLERHFGGRREWHAPSENITTFQTGGPIGLLVEPSHYRELSVLAEMIHHYQLPFLVLGNGSNTLIRDGGFPGVVIKIGEKLQSMLRNGQRIRVSSGTSLKKVVHYAVEAGLSGLEFAVDIPGTVGGGLTMNAGMYEGTLGALVKTIQIFNFENHETEKISAADCEFSYRRSVFQRKNFLILDAEFQLETGDTKQMMSYIEEIVETRKKKYPLEYPNAGSIFKRPEGMYAGYLIEKTGLKGVSVGDAAVSDKHANFIINRGQATAEDVENLIELVQERVFARFGVLLEKELKIYGERIAQSRVT